MCSLLKKDLVKGYIAFCIFFCLAAYITYPLIFHIGSFVTGYGDELVIAWIQNWVIHTVTGGNILSLFEANLYYPFHHTFAYSETFITTSILSIIPLELIKQPIATVNFTFISSLILLSFSIYMLAFYLTKDFLSSLLAGTLVIFSPAVLDKAVHLQILAIEWVPLASLFFILWIDKQKSRYLAISLLFFLLQTYNSFLPGYFILFSYCIIFSYFYFYDKVKVTRLIKWKNIGLLIVSFLIVVPIAIPYFQVSGEFHYVRDIRDTIHLALQPEDFLYSGSASRLHNLLLTIPFIKQTSPFGEVKPGYLGFIFTLLALYTLWVFLTYFKKNTVYVRLFCIIALVGLILSFGPALHINRQTIHSPFLIPLPYAVLYYIVPGFKGIRDSERWEMLFILAISVAIALVMQQVFKNYSLRKRVVIYFFLFVGITAEFSFPMHFEKVPQVKDFPGVYTWLATTPKNTNIIIMPIYNWGRFPYTQQEIWREYYSTIEFRNMVNGYSGFSPPPWQDLVESSYKNFPQQQSIVILKKLGINYIIVDKKAYDILYNDKQKTITGSDVLRKLQKNASVKLVKQFGEEYVFAF